MRRCHGQPRHARRRKIREKHCVRQRDTDLLQRRFRPRRLGGIASFFPLSFTASSLQTIFRKRPGPPLQRPGHFRKRQPDFPTDAPAFFSCPRPRRQGPTHRIFLFCKPGKPNGPKLIMLNPYTNQQRTHIFITFAPIK